MDQPVIFSPLFALFVREDTHMFESTCSLDLLSADMLGSLEGGTAILVIIIGAAHVHCALFFFPPRI